MCLIMLPKMIAHRRSIRGTTPHQVRGSVATGIVHVSGVRSSPESAKVTENTLQRASDEPANRLSGSQGSAKVTEDAVVLASEVPEKESSTENGDGREDAE